MKAIEFFKGIKFKKYIIFIFPVLALLAYLSFYIYKFEFRKTLLEINFLSTQRSRSVFIKTPNGKTILIGAGDKEIIRDITKLIPFYKRRIDFVFIPSAVPNQIAGLIDVFDRYEIGKAFIGKIIATSTTLTQLNKIIKKNKIEVEQLQYGSEINIDNILFKIIFPYSDFKFNKTSLPELGIIVLYKDTGFCLLGNLSKTIQKEISNKLFESFERYQNKIPKENIIELFNSGIESKLSKDFINKTNPKYIQTTKTKTTTWFSNGSFWERGD